MSKKGIKICYHNVSFQYHTEQWVLRNFSFSLEPDQHLLITGPNGSGKSTFFGLTTGYFTVTEGAIRRYWNSQPIEKSQFFRFYTWIGPNLSPPLYLTVRELCEFWFSEKGLNQKPKEILTYLAFSENENKSLSSLSSGLFQKLMIGLSLFSPAPLLLLDEPTAYLDQENKKWFFNELSRLFSSRQIMLATNDVQEIQFFLSQNTNVVALSTKAFLRR